MIPAMTESGSGELLRRSRHGDPEAMASLVQHHLPGLRAFVRARMSPLLRAHESQSDLVQSVCKDLFAALDDGFDYRGEESFRAWLYTAALNKLRNRERHLRAQRRDARRQTPLVEGPGSDPSLAACYATAISPTQRLIDEEEIRRFEAAMDELPEHYREVIALSRLARLGREQIAARMGRSEASVRNLLPRALVALAQALERRQRREP